MDDMEYYVEHVVFAFMRTVYAETSLYYRSTSHHDAVRELRHGCDRQVDFKLPLSIK